MKLLVDLKAEIILVRGPLPSNTDDLQGSFPGRRVAFLQRLRRLGVMSNTHSLFHVTQSIRGVLSI